MRRGLCRQVTRGSATYREGALVYGNQRARELSAAEGSLEGKGNPNSFFVITDRKHASMPHQEPDAEPASLSHRKWRNLWGSGSTWHLGRLMAMSSGTCASTLKACVCPSLIRHYGRVHHAQRSISVACLPCMPNGSHQSTAMEGLAQVEPIHGSLNACSNLLRTYSTSVEGQKQTNVGKEETDQRDAYVTQSTSSSFDEVKEQTNKGTEETNQEDAFSQMLEMMGFLVDGDLSAAANELRQAQQEMLLYMRRCSRVLFAVGGVHLTWGGMMFYALESPLNHAVLAEVCMSSLVICGLAYQLRQTVKPIEFFTNREEHRKMRIIFLARQVTRMLGAFFHRSRGIALVVSLSLMAHSLSCVRFVL